MPTGRIEIVLAYTGDLATVQGALDEMLANARQRALTAEYARQGAAAGVVPWAKAVIVEDDGVIVRHGSFHVDPTASDADVWGIVDDRLPDEPSDATPPPPDPTPPPDGPDLALWPLWEPWTSGLNEDLYAQGAQVRHDPDGQGERFYTSDIGNNHYEPPTQWTEVFP